MTTIDQIKQQLRDIIELSDKATPAPWIHYLEQGQVGNVCTPDLDSIAMTQERIEIAQKHGSGHREIQNKQRDINASFISTSRNLTPKMARALLTTIDSIETALHYAHFVEKQDYEELAKSLETICREWEVYA
jgi:hypothetical protein